mmetsp:Transcript_8594/g.16396  ORF Transcript_8594/g.16396 Transcript_8594/m.16396 type:complete len:227 (-) Transcript_8594:454-1134(-)|eukprot:CAMPEP_0175062716 /NCGR_PEP_ID=MMETSP0052_2-20121109/14327_1 /TAXON_ID=51329 ORGANISM="Polytomella parva, Strain SAG 63-3" /NCGR_SAMPLE_ID=MMETSP0052_2 /ASSEMBLY_ACC=CAM_ASM_000194 /LENGTH=226 /DNA_ID=CAMNT_0016328777 /DNA_START=179 /DNA_END=859 /DNA_ORIENTATION=-
MPLKLIYFPLPGRAENTRLMLSIGNIPFEEERISREDWPQYKTKTPFGQMPVLQLEDGTYLAQSFAIEKLVEKLAGLNVTDPIQEARIDEASYLFNEIMELVRPANHLPTLEERLATRKKLLEPLKLKLNTVEKFIAEKLASSDGPYLFGAKVTRADISLFTWTSIIISGFMEGFPEDILDGYPSILKLRHHVASHPGVKKFYEKEEDPYRKVCQSSFTEAALQKA